MSDSGHDLNPDGSSEGALARLASVSPHVEDEILAERIERELDVGGLERPLTLSGAISAIPLLRSRPISLDAVIDVIVRGLSSAGMSVDAIEAKLMRDAPEFAEAIRDHMALRGMLTSLGEQSPAPPVDRFVSLPVSFGPEVGPGQHRYELVERVGRGSEGDVFRAFDRKVAADGRPLQVAIKVLHQRAEGLADRAIDEVARVMRVRHASVVSLLDWGTEGGVPYLVYEFIEGESLDRRQKQASVPRDAKSAARTSLRLAEGIQAIHNAGIAHRDLKPNNILVDREDQAFIADFGLAEPLSTTGEGSGGGSLGFAAPEQLRGMPGGTENLVDVYALGGVLYWLLTGKYPNGESVGAAHRAAFGGLGAGLTGVSGGGAGESGSALPLRGRSATLLQIALKALSPEPGERHSSADAFANDLRRWLSHEPVLPFDRSRVRRASLAVRRAPFAAGFLAFALVAVVVGWRADLQRQRLALELVHQEALLAGEAARSAQVTESVDRLIMVAKEYASGRGDTSWLSMFSILETIVERGAMSMPGAEQSLLRGRIGLTNTMLLAAEETGRRDSAEMAMWETALAFWLLQAGQFEDAERVSNENVARLGSILPSDDPWLVVATGLNRVATVRRWPGTSEAARARAWLADHSSDLPVQVRALAVETDPEE